MIQLCQSKEQHKQLLAALEGSRLMTGNNIGASSAAAPPQTHDLTGAGVPRGDGPFGKNAQASAYRALDLVARRLCNGSTGQEEMSSGKNLRKALAVSLTFGAVSQDLYPTF